MVSANLLILLFNQESGGRIKSFHNQMRSNLSNHCPAGPRFLFGNTVDPAKFLLRKLTEQDSQCFLLVCAGWSEPLLIAHTTLLEI